MELTAADKITLRERYQDWGLDTVRDDLKRPFRHVFVSRERNEFAKTWVGETEVKEEKQQTRRRRMVRILMIAAIIEVGVAVGLQLDLPL
jgi:hypothetical protein